ncbi:hypothetical protein [Candidatus Viridilinea mediisalina]|uniref:DUF5673 domain-containing protein n=1 Tax=Candidatus Viridilinea mediisalina TaxID=2024553 RepID=A0A2A6RFZ1_9CHLR|nr:hypothetical protein [Candidatus Viridilinea mediisalina]PDW01806.1 hypothetical protein CJ255_17240 [Candidatus Viridilinea mediisalina]
MQKPNPRRLHAYGYAAITSIGWLLAGAVWVFELRLNAWQEDLLIIGLVVCLFTTMITIYSFYQAQQIDAIINGHNLLVHWRYAPHEWRTYLNKDLQQYEQNTLFMALLILLLPGFFLFVTRAEYGYFLGYTGLIIWGFLLYRLGLLFWRYTQPPQAGAAYITLNGIYIGRQLHAWAGPGTNLTAISLDNPEQPRRITVTIKASSVAGIGQRYSHVERISFPVPATESNSAAALVAKIAQHHGV